MPDIPASWLVIITGIGGAISVAIGYVVRYVLSGKDTEIAALKAECTAYRLRIDTMQNEQLSALKDSLAVEKKNADVQQRTAAALEMLAKSRLAGAT